MNNIRIIKRDMNSRAFTQKGISLVELLISMVVGLFLLAGVVTNFIGTKDSEQMRNAIGEMDANAQLALNTLRQNISHAGYASIQNIALDKAFYSVSDGLLDNPLCRDGVTRELASINTAIENKPTKDNGRADRLTVVSLADNPCIAGRDECKDDVNLNTKNALYYIDCTGGGATRDEHVVACSTDPDRGIPNPIRKEAKIFSSFYLKAVKRELHCIGSRGGGQPIIDNVYAMQFLYGVRQDDGKIYYRGADAIDSATPPQWGQVRSVQIALLMQSRNPNVLNKPVTVRKYTLLDKDVTTPDTEKQRLFRVYSTTVNLENLNKEPLL